MLCAYSLPNLLCAASGCTFFDISTSKSAPIMVCFVTFYFQMCFATPRALLRPLHFQNRSKNGVFYHFLLPHVLRHHDVSTSRSRPNLRCLGTFYFQMCFALERGGLFKISTSTSRPNLRWKKLFKRASCHNGVQFLFLICPDVVRCFPHLRRCQVI